MPPSRCVARSPAAPTSWGSAPGCRNQVQSILHRNLIGRCPAADLFGNKGRVWLATQELPPDEHQAVGALLRQLDFHGQELRIVDADLGRVGLERAEVRRLMTIPGVDATVALAIVAAVGDFGRFSSPQRLVSYLGLNPRVRQSGGQPAQHGRITKQGRAQARGMLVEAAWAAAKTPGPLRAFYERVRARRGMQVAVVATAGKLATLCWHLVVGNQDYAFARPSLTDKQAPGAGAARRHAAPARAQGHRGRLFPQGGPPTRAGAHRAGRSRLPSARRGLAAQAASDQAPMTS
jgi:transposase